MDELRPDRDEVDQFRAGRGKPVPAAKSAATPPPAKPQSRPTTATTNNVPATATGASRQAIWLLCLALVIIAGAGLWQVNYWSQRVNALETQLTDAVDFIGQNKLLMARFEGQLAETGESVEQTGSTAEQRLNKLTADIASLLKKQEQLQAALTASEKSGANLKAEMAKVGKAAESLSVQVGKVSEAQAGLKATLESTAKLAEAQKTASDTLAKDFNALRKETSQGSLEQKLALENFQSRMDEMDTAAALKPRIAALEKQMNEVNSAIQSIDASRLQFNERLLNLDRRVEDVARTVPR